MTTAELIKTLADLGYGQFTAPSDWSKALPKLSRTAKSTLRMTNAVVTNGSVLVCAIVREDSAVYFAESAIGSRADRSLTVALAGAGTEPGELPPPKLPALEWDRKTITWIGDWHPHARIKGVWKRYFVQGPGLLSYATVCTAESGFSGSAPVDKPVYPEKEEVIFSTIEEAQAECERELLAAGDVR